ncbi:MAG: TraR/DksA C4-type zinc finger protein [Akkermansiaceae bacterium]|jgi:DnaK suppressor protein|nr:TraR/DksA C4-type zinc finger protein [Luteolibacter sp.]
MAAKKTTKKIASKPPVTKAKSKPLAAKKPVAKKPAAKAPVKKLVKKAAAPVKKAAPSKKPAAKPVVKKAAVTAKKVAKVVAKKPVAPVKKVVAKKPALKAVPKKKVSKPSAPVKAAPKKVEAKKPELKKAGVKKPEPKKPEPKKPEPKKVEAAKPVVKLEEAKKVAAKKPSLFSTPPPAPIKPRFVPPKAELAPKPSTTSKGHHTPAFIDKQRKRLLDLRDILVDSMCGMTRDTIRNAPEGSEASGSGQHQGDAGSDAYDRDFALSVLAKEQDALYEIEQALRRIKSGTYGTCEISELKIPIARLEAIPFARLTVECQAQWEKEYGNRRFRPSDEVGFSGGIPQEDEESVTVSLDDDDE